MSTNRHFELCLTIHFSLLPAYRAPEKREESLERPWIIPAFAVIDNVITLHLSILPLVRLHTGGISYLWWN
jgi:hypothetical protein